MHDHAGAVLLHAFEYLAEMVTACVDGFAQQPLQTVPRGQDLRQALFRDHPPGAVERDAPLHRDAEVARSGAALLQRFQQFRMCGDAGAAADQVNGGAFIDVCVPAHLPQKCRGKQAGHRTANDDGAAPAPVRR